MRYWLDKGADGFRVDMADSLVKFDGEDKQETIKVWQKIFARFRNDYPEAAFVSEWGKPIQALKAGFDMDFYLDWRNNGYNILARNTDDPLGRSEDLSFSSRCPEPRHRSSSTNTGRNMSRSAILGTSA